MWMCQSSAHFKFIPYTHTHTHTHHFEDRKLTGLTVDIASIRVVHFSQDSLKTNFLKSPRTVAELLDSFYTFSVFPWFVYMIRPDHDLITHAFHGAQPICAQKTRGIPVSCSLFEKRRQFSVQF